MLRGDDLPGSSRSDRSEARSFTDKQIDLVTTSADQAVIAIEKHPFTAGTTDAQPRSHRSLEQQQQQVRCSVSSQAPLLSSNRARYMIANAVTLAGAKQGQIRQYDGEFFESSPITTRPPNK